jgi:16S rRNA processing protein RimM
MFAEFQTRDSVEPLRMRQVFVLRDKLPLLQDDEYYLCDLVDLDVFSKTDGKLIGKVVTAHDYGAGTFLEIMLVHSEEIATHPFHKESVVSVDLINNQITIAEEFLLSM